jgi:hypothetical protein
MNNWKRLIYYLLLNVIVSACTTLFVINAWDRARNPDSTGFFPFTGPLSISFERNTGQGDLTQETPSPLTGANPQPTPTQVFIVYQVQTYDTFDSIAQAYGISVEELISVNGFTQDQALGPGEALLIPVHPTPAPEAGVRVVGVLGPGDIASERVVIAQEGEGTLPLSGWTLEDQGGNSFVFPSIELTTNGSQVQIYTKAGTNAAGEVFWGLAEPVWKPGETVSLRDSSGTLRLTYQIP